MRLLATRLDEAAGEITRLQGGTVAAGLPITAPRELAHYEGPLRDLASGATRRPPTSEGERPSPPRPT